jgi:hypothetical protein
METPEELNTLSETINFLKESGFTEEFEIKDDSFIIKSGEKFKPDELSIIKVYRFEGVSDPADMSVLYAIKTSSGLKGIYVDAFGVYADQNGEKAAELLKKVKIIKDH